MGIPGPKAPKPEALKVRMVHDHRYQPLPQAPPPVFLQDIHIAKIGKRGIIRNHPGQAYLPALFVQTEAQGIFQGKGDPLSGPVFRPIGPGEKGEYLLRL